MSAIGSKEKWALSLGDGFRPTYVNAESKCKCDLKLMDFFKEDLFCLIGCSTWVD